MPLSDLRAPINGDMWQWNGSVWVPAQLAYSDASLATEAWTAVAGGIGFTAGWGDSGGGLAPCAFRKIHGGAMVELRGWASRSSGVSNVPFVLPVGYRPPNTNWIESTCSSGFQVWSIDASGNITVNWTGLFFGTPTVFSMDGVTFAL